LAISRRINTDLLQLAAEFNENSAVICRKLESLFTTVALKLLNDAEHQRNTQTE